MPANANAITKIMDKLAGGRLRSQAHGKIGRPSRLLPEHLGTTGWCIRRFGPDCDGCWRIIKHDYTGDEIIVGLEAVR